MTRIGSERAIKVIPGKFWYFSCLWAWILSSVLKFLTIDTLLEPSFGWSDEGFALFYWNIAKHMIIPHKTQKANDHFPYTLGYYSSILQLLIKLTKHQYLHKQSIFPESFVAL